MRSHDGNNHLFARKRSGCSSAPVVTAHRHEMKRTFPHPAEKVPSSLGSPRPCSERTALKHPNAYGTRNHRIRVTEASLPLFQINHDKLRGLTSYDQQQHFILFLLPGVIDTFIIIVQVSNVLTVYLRNNVPRHDA